METKKEIRKRILKERDNISDDKRFRSEILITERIIGHQWYYSATDLLIYKRIGSEDSTDEIIRDALLHGKRVWLPKVLSHGENNVMEFYPINMQSKLLPGYKGIPEPEAGEAFSYTEEKQATTLMIMPGAAFDPKRNRIGYGKGFYDRYLMNKKTLHTIAIGFDCQMTGDIPAEENDCKPMQVICL